MSYRKRIEEILSDGNWHCILPIIAETGLSARNRISEMNNDYSEEHGIQRYIGVKCSIEHTHTNKHKAKLYMYRLNPVLVSNNPHDLDTVSLQIEKDIDEAAADEMQKEWESYNRDQKKQRIQTMLKEAIENAERKL